MNLWQAQTKKDGQSSIQEHTLKTVSRHCTFADHVVDNEFPTSRIAVCKKCGKEIPLILGFHEIKNGKILTVALKR